MKNNHENELTEQTRKATQTHVITQSFKIILLIDLFDKRNSTQDNNCCDFLFQLFINQKMQDGL